MVLKVCLTNYNWLNSVNERDRTGLSEQVIPHYSQKGNHQLKKNKHTHMDIPRTRAAVGISLSFI